MNFRQKKLVLCHHFKGYIYILVTHHDVSGHGSSYPHKSDKGEGNDHNEYDYDPSYAYVLFKNR